MHRDKKLGLALGILLVGSAAALFFRNDPIQSAQLPGLENPEALDAAIREQSGSLPYLTEAEPPATRPSVDAATANLQVGSRSPGDIPAPIATRERVTLPPLPAVRPASPPHTSADAPAPPAGKQRLYQVQAGDTLTGLASRFLGNGARFLELYRANQDVMHSPHDLRAGMTIRIPDAATAPPPADAAASTPARDVEAPALPHALPGAVDALPARQTPAQPAASSTPKSPASNAVRRTQPRPKSDAWVEPREDDPEEELEEPYSPSTVPKNRLFVPVPRAQPIRAEAPTGTDVR